MKKHFLITVDTEGDNLWSWELGQHITTENAHYIARFQSLCEQYGFVPVYLTNYEMAMDEEYCRYIGKKAAENKCEIGMHLHAWNSPPDFELENRFFGCPYITEYPEEVIYDKHRYLKNLIMDRLSVEPVTYRSGRWATNDTLFQVINQLGFAVDCSITPGIAHRNPGSTVAHGNIYRNVINKPSRLCENLIEIPMTTRLIKSCHGKTLKNRAHHILIGEELWLRPANQNLDEMLRLKRTAERENMEYLEFMIHSSELMPGGSPYTKTEESVEAYYQRMEQFFASVADQYQGITMKDYSIYLLENGLIK
jgi:hypothetical protein